jgi:hypothetical protein
MQVTLWTLTGLWLRHLYRALISYWPIGIHDFVLTRPKATVSYNDTIELCLATSVNLHVGACLYFASVRNSFASIVRSLTVMADIIRGLRICSTSHSSLPVYTSKTSAQYPHLHTPRNTLSRWLLLLHRGRQFKANDLFGGM